MTCPNCEYHKRRAQIWRHQAYKLGGKPLPWEPNMTDLRKAAEMALEFVTWFASDDHSIRPKHKAPEIAEALRQALDYPTPEQIALAQQIRPKGKSRIGQALAQEQEPVCFIRETDWSYEIAPWDDPKGFPVYTAPPKRDGRFDLPNDIDAYERGVIDGMQKQMKSTVEKAVNAMTKREWVGLTDAEIAKADCVAMDYVGAGDYGLVEETIVEFARAIEAKLKEKNGF